MGLSLDEIKSTDLVKDIDGVKIIIDKDLEGQYEEIFVDYVKFLFKKRFFVAPTNGGQCR